MSDNMEWQLPVKDDVLNGKGYVIHGNAKIHCFDDNGNALCNQKIWMVPGYFETTDFGEKDIDKYPEYFYKKCVMKFKKKMYNLITERLNVKKTE